MSYTQAKATNPKAQDTESVSKYATDLTARSNQFRKIDKRKTALAWKKDSNPASELLYHSIAHLPKT